MDSLYAFILWFAGALVGTFLFLATVGNPFIESFVLALVISILATRPIK